MRGDSSGSEQTPTPWATVTHARIRAAQGDSRQARQILKAILQQEPSHPEATRLLGELAHAALGATRNPTAVQVERLRRWLGKLAPGS